MLKPFDQMPDHARVWVYQSNKPLDERSQVLISSLLNNFCSGWVAHQQPLQSSYFIANDRFIILAVDEQVHAASGCSIDSSVSAIRAIETELGINLFTRLEIAVLNAGEVEVYTVRKLKEMVSAGAYDPELKIFNTMVSSLAEFKNSWLLPIEKSWLGRFAPVS